MKYLWRLHASFLFLCSCASSSPKYQLDDGSYLYKQQGERYRKADVYVSNDSVKVFSGDGREIAHKPLTDQLFLKQSFDLDVMTVAFKYRPGSIALPRQLLTDFNGNIFIGYRVDRFRARYRSTPLGNKVVHSHRGITLGGFGGLGSAAVTPWTTRNLVTDEYNGFVLSRGLALLIGLNTLTVGAGVGWDYLTDRDKRVWIYQNKPWYGLAIGLNLN
jgi:hypothetical protein